MAASRTMAKRKRPPEDKLPSFPATPAYKQWVWEQIRRRGWVQQDLIDEMKRVDLAQSKGVITKTITTGWLTQFLGPENATRRYASNTEFMPAMNAALGIAPPAVCDPLDPLAQLKDRLDFLWGKMPHDQREQFLQTMESVLKLAERY